jgi:hypothetical protein
MVSSCSGHLAASGMIHEDNIKLGLFVPLHRIYGVPSSAVESYGTYASEIELR